MRGRGLPQRVQDILLSVCCPVEAVMRLITIGLCWLALAAGVARAQEWCDPAPDFGFQVTQDAVKTVALTFDDGPDYFGGTIAVLDALAAEGVPGTFFINSRNMVDGIVGKPAIEAIVRRIVADGHTLGNHGATHGDLATMTPEQVEREFADVEDSVARLGITTPLTIWRAPFGSPFQSGTQDQKAAVGAVARQHAVHVGWSCDGKDYEIPQDKGDDDYVAAYMPCIDQGVTGPVLMHSKPQNTFGAHPQALRRVIQAYRNAGYQFVSAEFYVQQKFGMSSRDVVAACRGGGGGGGSPPSTPDPTPDPPNPDPPGGAGLATTISGYDVMGADNTSPGALAEYTVSRAFVDNVNIVAVHERDWEAYKYKQLDVTYQNGPGPAITARFQVWDKCADADCDGCCTRNAAAFGHNFLLDVDASAAWRVWGIQKAEDTLLGTATFVEAPPPIDPEAVLRQFNGTDGGGGPVPLPVPPPPPPPVDGGDPVPPGGGLPSPNAQPASIIAYDVMGADNTSPGALAEYTVSRAFVDNVNIVAVLDRDWEAYKYQQLDVTYRGTTARFQVWDKCAEEDCGESARANGNNFLLNVDASAALRVWGVESAESSLVGTATFVVVPPPVDPQEVLRQFNN